MGNTSSLVALWCAFLRAQESTYGYDHAGQRVLEVAGGATTTYPSKLYSIVGATTTEYIYAGNDLVATVEGDGNASTTRYVHPDHLGSTNVVSDGDMEAVQVLDYYPYGAARIDTGSDVSQREFIGQFQDEETDLSYLNARYYEGSRGQFLSQDPVHLSLRNIARVKEYTTLDLRTYLSDPQALNSYAYARGNPIRFTDPKGLWYGEISAGGNFYVLSASVGLRFDNRGVEGFLSGGPTIGVSGPVQLAFSSGNLSHEPRISVSRTAEFMLGPGIGITREGAYDYENPLGLGSDQSTSYSASAGIGGGVSQKYTLSAPLFNYGSKAQTSAPQNYTQQSSLLNRQSSGASYSQLVNPLKQVISLLRAYIQSQSDKKNN